VHIVSRQTQLVALTHRYPRHQPRVVRQREMLCGLCSAVGAPFMGQHQGEAGVQDVKHLVLECAAYKFIRSRHSDVLLLLLWYAVTYPTIVDCDHQDQLGQLAHDD
jgi:hypothetical protein